MSELFRMLADIKRDCHPAMVEQMIKLESTLDSALQQAHRQGWEQAKREAYSIVENEYCSSWDRALRELEHLEYKEPMPLPA